MSTIPNYHKSRCPKCARGQLMPKFDWSWIDHVYCISVKDREDKGKQAELEFHKAGLCKKVVFIDPIKTHQTIKDLAPEVVGTHITIWAKRQKKPEPRWS